MSRLRSTTLIAAATAVSWCVAAAPAMGVTVTATTNDGGTCQIQSTASRAGANITYGVQVTPCTARFGVRYAVSQGMAYDSTRGVQDGGGVMPMTQGPIPYANSKAFAISPLCCSPGDAFFTRIDLSVVLNSGVVASTTTSRRKGRRRCRPRDRPDRDGRSNDPDRGRACRRRRARNVTTTSNKLEQWLDPGPDCIVTTTYNASDTLGCILIDPA